MMLALHFHQSANAWRAREGKFMFILNRRFNEIASHVPTKYMITGKAAHNSYHIVPVDRMEHILVSHAGFDVMERDGEITAIANVYGQHERITVPPYMYPLVGVADRTDGTGIRVAGTVYISYNDLTVRGVDEVPWDMPQQYHAPLTAWEVSRSLISTVEEDMREQMRVAAERSTARKKARTVASKELGRIRRMYARDEQAFEVEGAG